MKITGRDIVIVTLQPWYYPHGSNANNTKNIAIELGKDNRILYVNAPITRKTALQKHAVEGVNEHIRIIREKKNPVRKVKEGFWELYPTSLLESAGSIPLRKAFSMITALNNRRFASDLRKAMDAIGFRNFILLNDNDIYNGLHLKKLLRPSLYVYYMRDFLQGYTYWKRHATHMEPQIIANADVVVTNSEYYANYCKTINSASHFVGQGCSLEYFDANRQYPIPEELASLKRPIVGYVGALDAERLDPAIVANIAHTKPDYSIVLVGPEDRGFAESELHALPNVYFLGRRPVEQVAGYLAAFDVCFNPQRKNQITEGNYPLKIDEYLAMGKPVVATRTTAMLMFEPYTFLANTPEEYPALIEVALQANSLPERNERIAFAHSHSWENCVGKIYQAILSKTKTATPVAMAE